MLGKIFELDGNNIIPKEECKIILPLKKIIEEYPEDHGKVFAYLHFIKSMNRKDNPYADVPLDRRTEIVLYDLGLEIDPDSTTIKAGLTCVEEMYYTTFYGVYRGIKSMLDKIGNALYSDDVDLNPKEGNMAPITRFIEKYEQLRKSFKVAYSDFEEETSGGKARGGAEMADDEEDDY